VEVKICILMVDEFNPDSVHCFLSIELELSINIQSYATCDTAKSSKHW
jgi:hypothetical protein